MAIGSIGIETECAYRPCWQANEVAKVLTDLERVSERRSQNLRVQRRQFERKAYLTMVTIRPTRKANSRDTSCPTLQTIARNISRSGVAILVPLFFEPDLPVEGAPLLQSANFFLDGTVLELGLRRPGGHMLWLYSTVVRSRTVRHDFIDVGLRFNARFELVAELGFE